MTPKHELSAILAALLIPAAGLAPCQVVDPDWTAPARLSRLEANVVDRVLLADPFGYSHACWIERIESERRYSVSCARFDGQAWSPAFTLEDVPDIWAGYMSALDAVIDTQGRLHVTWSGNWGPVFHRVADVRNTLDPAAWSKAVSYNVPAYLHEFFVDSSGTYHLIYIKYPGEQAPAVLYQRSSDAGLTWTTPANLETGVPSGQDIWSLEAAFDGQSGLHVAWTRTERTTYLVKAVRYAQSLDAGNTWLAPFTVDEATAAAPELIRMAAPELNVRGSAVAILWQGGGVINVGRRCRLSSDSGRSWGPIQQVFGDLHGKAGTDGSGYDATGSLQVAAQLRYPHGVYHAVWRNGAWSSPKLVYLIARDPTDPMGDRIHAHEIRLVAAAGGQLVMAFESCGARCQDTSLPPNAVLFALHSPAKTADLPPFASVSSASMTAGGLLAPGSLATGYGSRLSAGTAAAPGLPVPELEGVAVEVIDAAGAGRLAPLLFVSPGQINYLVPAGTATGRAAVRVRGPERAVAAGPVEIGAVAPALFSAGATGRGTVAGYALQIAGDGSRTGFLLYDPATLAPVALDLAGGAVYLEMYGTGIRGYRSAVTAQVGGIPVPVLAAVAHGQFPGLDQVNIGPLPAALSGRGSVTVQLTADGIAANPVTVTVR